MTSNGDIETLGNIFKGVFDLANTELHIFNYWIAPLDIWVTTAIIYMLIDILLFYTGWGRESDE